MNSFIDELASLVPTCNTKTCKLDKLSVLRMAVQHMKTLQSSTAKFYTEINHKPAFFSNEELKHLIQRAADGFLFVADCDRGKILFVSESVDNILNYSQNDLIGQSLFDYLHPKDIAKVKEQLSSADTVPRERCINAKSSLSVKTDINPCSLRLCSGVRRSFFCRMKCNRPLLNTDDEDFSSTCVKTNAERKGFCTIHSTGYLKSWSPAEVDLDENNELDSDGCNSSCLVAVGRLHPHAVFQPMQSEVKVKPMEFVSRHAIDGKFVFVDQRATAILAYLPQELLGTSFYEYFHEDDIAHLAECHWQVLQMRKRINTNCYKLKIKDGSFITLRSHWFSFLNPWTKEVEYIVSTNTVVTPAGYGAENSYHQPASSPQKSITVRTPDAGEPDLHTVPGIADGVRESTGKTGRMIAEELLRIQSHRVSEASATLENLVAKGTERERDEPARDYSTAPDVKTSKEDVFGALGAAEEAQSTGQTEGGRDLLEADVIDYVACMSASVLSS
ncbi:aryl hydrocarbon receptor nuclear translocator-like 1b [Thunnus albacares]|uniref:aryl hydrocarbon receptor nuclear translocator-like 1b n=1 Tax=Thunnus albacares TaxID=8236 RepID=UPI001CF71B6B|nr:aryl hydrocarbon receptor nuclear translocator-like 1b [Thunnus albacares]